MNEAKAFEAVVVGGGPAGCSAAISLAQAGKKVVMCEAGSYPKGKVCGEFLSPECGVLLGDLGMSSLVAESGARALTCVRLTAANGAAWEARLPGQAWGLSRAALDEGLARQAMALGVEVRQSTQINRIKGNLATGFHVEGRTSQGQTVAMESPVVIAAYGKRSILDRVWKREFFSRSDSFVGLKAHYKGPTLNGCVELHAFAGGYCGLAEIEEGLTNVSLLVRAEQFKSVTQASLTPLDTFVHWMGEQNRCLETWFLKARMVESTFRALGQISFVAKECVVDDILLAGDSAGLMAPLAGDGIAMALQSGRLAAYYSGQYLSGAMGPGELKTGYARAWRQNFGPRLRLARFLQSCMLQPDLFGLALNVFGVVPGLGRQLIVKTRATQPWGVA